MRDKLLVIVALAFEGERDKSGEPYFDHCYYVSHALKNLGCDEDTVMAGLAHDLIEDCKEWTCDRLRIMGYSEKMISLVDVVSKKPGQSYLEYVIGIVTHQYADEAMQLKMCDIDHNMQVKRLKGLTDKDIRRTIKYQKTYAILSSVLKEKDAVKRHELIQAIPDNDLFEDPAYVKAA